MRQRVILIFRCLKDGMNPELVDASLRLKNIEKNKINNDEFILINNLEPLKNIEIVSEVLRVIKRTMVLQLLIV